MVRHCLVLLSSMLPLVLGLDPGSEQREAASTTQPELRIGEAGVTVGKSIESGFVFVDGRFLDSPYVVSRRGIAVFVNDTMVQPPRPWSTQTRSAGDVDPPLPSTIRQSTSFYDPAVRDYLDRKTAYIARDTSAEAERQAMEAMWRHMPFVKEATILAGSPGTLEIETYSGDKYNIALDIARRQIHDDKESVLLELEATRQHFERLLSRGAALYFFSKGGRITVSHANAPEQLARLVPILRSDRTPEQKFEEIKNAGVLFVDKDNFPSIVTAFSASAQLEVRVREARAGRTSSAPAKQQ